MFRWEIDTRNLTAKLRLLESNATNAGKIMASVATRMHAAVEENFAQEGRRPRWKKLSEKYKKRRYKRGYTGKILQASGDMAASVSQSHTSNEARVSTPHEYAKYHHGQRMSGHPSKGIMPRREFLKLTPDDMDDINDRIKRGLTKGAN